MHTTRFRSIKGTVPWQCLQHVEQERLKHPQQLVSEPATGGLVELGQVAAALEQALGKAQCRSDRQVLTNADIPMKGRAGTSLGKAVA
jgi:hypothetical protein